MRTHWLVFLRFVLRRLRLKKGAEANRVHGMYGLKKRDGSVGVCPPGVAGHARNGMVAAPQIVSKGARSWRPGVFGGVHPVEVIMSLRLRSATNSRKDRKNIMKFHEESAEQRNQIIFRILG